MHFQVCHRHFVIFIDVVCKAILNLLYSFCEQFVNFSHVAANGEFEPPVFSQNDYNLFKYHDCDQIELQLLEVLIVIYVDEVTDVSIHKLEHVYLIDD